MGLVSLLGLGGAPVGAPFFCPRRAATMHRRGAGPVCHFLRPRRTRRTVTTLVVVPRACFLIQIKRYSVNNSHSCNMAFDCPSRNYAGIQFDCMGRSDRRGRAAAVSTARGEIHTIRIAGDNDAIGGRTGMSGSRSVWRPVAAAIETAAAVDGRQAVRVLGRLVGFGSGLSFP